MFYVIDNFLPQDYFKQLQELVIYNHRFPYYCNKGKVYESDTDYQFTHCLAIEKEIISDWYKDFIPLFQKLNAHTVERAKINLQPKTTKIERSSTHKDYEESDIKACCLYLNNNNGYTFFGDDKVYSVENRLVLFNGRTLHGGTTCTDNDLRVVLNINYF